MGACGSNKLSNEAVEAKWERNFAGSNNKVAPESNGSQSDNPQHFLNCIDSIRVTKDNEIRMMEKIIKANEQKMTERIRRGVTTGSTLVVSEKGPVSGEIFVDSVYYKKWLSPNESDALYQKLLNAGLRLRDQLNASKSMKYPLSTITYGYKRRLDGALALDRWGSYHESWCKVEEPSEAMQFLCDKIRIFFQLRNEQANSIVVNYYWNGEHTCIPAHKDTVACLEENSKIYCLSLGSTREFILCEQRDFGKSYKSDMSIVKEWHVSHGDLFAIGKETNEKYCHAIPKQPGLQDLRISVIIRSVDKSFINFNTVSKSVIYANGNVKSFQAECMSTKSYIDVGVKEHVSDMIAKREELKRLTSKLTTSFQSDNENNNSNDMSSAVPLIVANFPEDGAVNRSPSLCIMLESEGGTSGCGYVGSGNLLNKRCSKQLDIEDPALYYLGEGLAVPKEKGARAVPNSKSGNLSSSDALPSSSTTSTSEILDKVTLLGRSPSPLQEEASPPRRRKVHGERVPFGNTDPLFSPVALE